MSRTAGTVILVLAMIILIVGVDVLYLRDRLWLRLVVNVAIVIVAGLIYLAFLRD
jgi:hypothetical protein